MTFQQIRYRSFILLCLPALGLLSSCGTASKMELDATREETMHYVRSRDLSAEVDSLAVPLVKKGETPGIVVGVLLPDGRMEFFGYGVTDRETKVKPDGDTIFATGSLSKGFLGVVTASLVHEGSLSWNDTLGKILPQAPLSADAKKITLLELATHTSGLPNQPLTRQTFGYFVQYLFTGKSFYRHFNPDYVFQYLSDFKKPSKPEVHYSSLGYALLGYALEQRTGLTLDALLDQKVVRPLGLQRTGYEPKLLPGYLTRARGYAGDEPKFIRRGQPVPDWTFTPLMKGAGGVYSSAKDLLTFAAAYFRTGDATLADALADTLQVRLPRAKDAPAIAWFVDTIDGQRITYQVGVVAGYTSYLGLDVDRRIAVVVLQNSFNWKNPIGHKLLVRLGRVQSKVAVAQ